MAGPPPSPEKTTPHKPPVQAPGPLVPGVGGARSVASETTLLRQSRLRAATLFLAATAAVLVVWGFLTGKDLGPLHIATGVGLIAACAVLSRREPLGPFQLKAMEFTVIGLMVADLAVIQYRQMLHAAVSEDAGALLAEGKNALFASLLLMFAYTMLVPNSWRAAAAVALAIIASPGVTEAVLVHKHPEVSRFGGAE